MGEGTTRYRFTIPNFPKEIYTKFQELRKGLDLTQQQCLILGILAICELGSLKLQPEFQQGQDRIDKLVAEVKEKYASKKAPI